MKPCSGTVGLKAIIVDDEQNSREVLKNYIEEYCKDIHVVSLCDSARSAYLEITYNKPDLVFLDIEMPKGSGFDLLSMFKPVPFKVIFITAYSEYAVEAFRYYAKDYLLKPIKISELMVAIAKAKKEIMLEKNDEMSELMEAISPERKPIEKLVINSTKGFVVEKFENIIMLKANSYCTQIYVSDEKIYTSSHNLKYYEDLLPPEKFLRIHNSYMVNSEHVMSFSNGGEVNLSNNLKALLSNKFRNQFMNYFKR